MKRSTHKFVLIALAVILLTLSACQPAATPTAEPIAPPKVEPTTAPKVEPTVAPAQPEKITLKVWDIFVRPEEAAIMEGIVERYQTANPNVTIVREAKNMDDLKATTALALGSEDGPDVVMVNQGQSDMGSLVAAKLLLPLNDYAKKYGWFDVFPGSLVKLNSWTEDGKQMGAGDFYGLPIQSEVVGVYYRKDLFEQNKLTVPTTLEEFEKAMETLKAAGVTPIAYGDLDGWPAIHLYSELQNAELAERVWYDEFMFTTGKVTFDNPANAAAATRLQDWIAKGYFTKGFEGIGYDDSWQLFSSGEGAMMLTGSWLSADLKAGPNGANIGFFALPPVKKDGYKLTVGGTGFGYAIRATSKNADLAAEYINYLYSADTAKAMMDAGLFPVYPLNTSSLEDGLVKDIANAWVNLNETDTIGYYMDWVTPTMYDTISASLQELQSSKLTPEEFVKKVNDDYTAYLVKKGVK